MACTRDTQGFAMKATYVEVNGKPVVVYKDPKTADGTKKSAKGLLRVDWGGKAKEPAHYILRDNVTLQEEAGGMLETVYKDGNILVDEKFSRLRERLKNA